MSYHTLSLYSNQQWNFKVSIYDGEMPRKIRIFNSPKFGLGKPVFVCLNSRKQ